jgi:hypothetical protein
MSSVYTPSPVALGSVTLPSDLDTRSAASVNVPMQAIADGVAYLGTSLADLTALAAIAAPTDGTVRSVLGFGRYVFKTSATTGLSPFRVAAGDATPGGWVSGTAHQTTLVRQVPLAVRVRGITQGSGTTPGPQAPTQAQQNFLPLASADGLLSFQAFLPVRTNTGATTNYGYFVEINDQMIDGATLTSAALLFGGFGHAGVPARQPAFGIVRGLATTQLGTAANLLSTGGGLVTLAAATQPAYDAAQVLVFTPDQNNVIDKTQYHYGAVFFDEAGTNAGAGGLGFLGISYQAIRLTQSIPDARRS